MRNDGIKNIVTGGVTAGLYVLLTLVSFAFGLASGAVQLRLSEALCILPAFTPAAIPGLFAGCILANIITGCALPDIVFGSLATLLGAIGTGALRKYVLKDARNFSGTLLSLLPPILLNTLTVTALQVFVYGIKAGWILIALSVFAGEFVSCGVFGWVLKRYIVSNKQKLGF